MKAQLWKVVITCELEVELGEPTVAVEVVVNPALRGAVEPLIPGAVHKIADRIEASRLERASGGPS